MGIISKFFGLNKSKELQKTSNDSYSAEIKKCMVKHKLKEAEYDLFALLYYQGHTSYRGFFKYVFGNNISKMKKIVKAAKKKANSGCNIDFTFVRFYKDEKNYIDLPFDVFTDKMNMPMRKRNTKLWNKSNIKRLLVNNPQLRDYDDDLIKETLMGFLLEKLTD